MLFEQWLELWDDVLSGSLKQCTWKLRLSHETCPLTTADQCFSSPPHPHFFFCFCLFVFFAFPSYISGVHHFWVRFLCDLFFNPTIKVVTFRLHGWCVLGVFLLPAFTHLGHEHQDLLSPCDEMHVCTDRLGLYSHPNEFWGEWSLNPC